MDQVTGRYRPMPFALETERLALRLLTPDDAGWDHELRGERDGGTAMTVDDVRLRLAELNADAHRTGIGFLSMRRRAEGDVVGYCGLLVGRATFDEPEIAYELLRRFHGHGYATEAAQAVLDAAFATGRRRIWATVRAWNAPSFRVLDKLSFRRDHVRTDDSGELVYLVRDADA
jgi:RimJ/RimL family protein N-acetyltransferase